MALMGADVRTFVAGHRGLVGSAIVRLLQARGFRRLLLAGRDELDLRDQSSVQRWFHQREPEFVFLAAGTVGGILANASRPAEFLYDNLAIAANVIEASHACRVRKLLYLSSGCIYPRDAAKPIPETALLTSPLEPTNEAYGMAKIAVSRYAGRTASSTKPTSFPWFQPVCTDPKTTSIWRTRTSCRP